MSEANPTFSESWYRVAGQRLALRAEVRVRRQHFRGQRWYVLENPLSNQFFRLRPAAYEFVSRLRTDRTVEQVWSASLERSPAEAPGQAEVLRLLGQLYQANLLRYESASDAAALFERHRQMRQRELTARWLNIMFARIPLLDPDQFLVRMMPVARLLLNPVGALLWVAVVLAGVKVGIDHWPQLYEQSQGVLAPANLPLLYAGLVLVKTLHEFGHAFLCRRFGGEVHTLGVMFMIFTPMPYVDVTSSWSFRSAWPRALVGMGGMMVELFVAALAAFLWAGTGPGTLHSLAYNILLVSSVSTLVFNLNPLLRFDGYYILSDLVQIPNLYQRAGRQLRYFAERHLFGLRQAERPAHSAGEAAWLTVYGVASGIYRVIVFGGILLLVADRFLLLGILMAVACATTWVLVPTAKFVQYLAASPVLERNRARAVAVTLGLAMPIVALLALVPLPYHFRAPGVLECRQWSEVHTETAGRVRAILVKSGAPVLAGQALAELQNPELETELQAAQAAREEVLARMRRAMEDRVADLKPLERRLETAERRLARLKADQVALTVTARHAGIWVSPEARNYEARWVPRGSTLGLVLNTTAFTFVATVAQKDGDRLFAGASRQAQVRLVGRGGDSLPVERLEVIPAEQRVLPSAALGWSGGGEVAVSPTDSQGTHAAEPFFEVRADLPATTAGLFHGRTGKLRVDLPPAPLLPRWLLRLFQLIQQRYQL